MMTQPRLDVNPLIGTSSKVHEDYVGEDLSCCAKQWQSQIIKPGWVCSYLSRKIICYFFRSHAWVRRQFN